VSDAGDKAGDGDTPLSGEPPREDAPAELSGPSAGPASVSPGRPSLAERLVRRKWLLLHVVAGLVTVAAGALLGARFMPEPDDDEPPPPPRLEVAGEALAAGDDAVAEALDLVRRYSRSELELELPDGSVRPLRPATLGAEIDRVHLADFLRAALSPDSPLARAYQRAREDDPDLVLRVPIPVRVDTARAVDALLAIKDDIDAPASDAVVDVDKRKLVPEKTGFRLDVYATLANVDAALRRGDKRVAAAGERLEPRIRASQLGNVTFDEVLGYFETRYTLGDKYRDRTYNLRLAASRLDGTVLLPGETFDFNETVGPRDEAHGYRVAPVIAQGELVDGIGGGTCQVSGTLHGAALFAGLEIVERYPHSRPSSYIKLGLDAAVAYPAINFRIRNDFDYPIVLHQTVRQGVVRAEILGPERKRAVTFSRRIDEILPFDEEIRETEDLPSGKRLLTQRGVPGFKTTVLRIVRDGVYALREKRVDEYPPTTQIVMVGTGSEERKSKIREDTTLEYVADEYLEMTQGPDIRTPGVTGDEPGGGTLETRTPGRTGRRGWQAEAGMKVFDSPEEDDDDGNDGDER
jgi:vancomycin resistance protein YoaR